MKRIKAGIFSENEKLFRFFELELITLGYETVWDHKHSDFDIAVIDVDTVNEDSIFLRCPTVRVGADLAEDAMSLAWPCDIERIRSVIESITHNSERNDDTKRGEDNTVYACGDDTVRVGGVRVKLSRTESLVLDMLCDSCGETVDRSKIMSAIGADEGNICDVYICRLRKKLEEPLCRRVIFTERGVGYRSVLRKGK